MFRDLPSNMTQYWLHSSIYLPQYILCRTIIKAHTTVHRYLCNPLVYKSLFKSLYMVTFLFSGFYEHWDLCTMYTGTSNMIFIKIQWFWSYKMMLTNILSNYRKQIFITQKVGLYWESNVFHFSVQCFLETFFAVIDI
jgi:hypothetical protein